jgi:antibiotic biosynthesis monooxygenase (ABM) superfamily enzyme
MSDESEVTTIVNRKVKKGHELEYANWFGRMTEVIKKAPGFRGVTVLVPGDSDSRIILYRFSDVASMEAWEDSSERKELMSEVKEYATQVYEKAGGLETWFHIGDARSA